MVALLAESYIHGLDPFAVRFTESFGIRWYGLAYAAGFVLAWLFIRWFARTGRSPLDPGSTGDLVTWVIVGVLVGGRLGYALFYEPRLIVGFSSSPPWWDLLAINKGGMASHGGILGVIAVCLLYGRRHGVPGLHLLDMGAVCCTGGLFLGRLANFVNAELWGRALPEARQLDPPWWSVKYPEQMLGWVQPPDASKLLGMTDAVGLVDVTPTQWQRWVQVMETDLLRGTVQEVVDAARAGNEAVIDALRDQLTAYYPSQLIQAFTDGPVLAGVLALIWLKPRVPGVIGAWFLITYGILRILTEFARQPDEGVALWFGLSRGQSLSILLVLAGVVVLVVRVGRDVPKLGGLLRGKS